MTEEAPSFDERVRGQLATKFPELVFRVSAPGTIDVLPRGGREPVAQIGLTSLAQQVKAKPADEEKLVAEHIGRLPFSKLTESLRGMPLPKPEKWFPRLIPQKRIDAMPAVQKPALRDFHEDIRIVLVAEFPHGDLYITQHDLDEQKLAFHDALTSACVNLAAYMRRSSVRAGPGPDGKTAMMIVDGHKHAAAAVLLPDFPKSFGAELGEEFFVTIPAFDQLIAFRTEPEVFVNNMLMTAKRAYDQSDYGVTPQLFKVDPESVTPVRLEGEEGSAPKIWLPS
jgi:hypothetical protein